MTREDRERMQTHSTMVYHIDIGSSIQLVLIDIKDGLYYFKGLEDYGGLTAKEVEECFVIMQL